MTTELEMRAEELARLSDAATSGPWTSFSDFPDTGGVARGVGVAVDLGNWSLGETVVERRGWTDQSSADVAFIAAAVNYVRDMLAAPAE